MFKLNNIFASPSCALKLYHTSIVLSIAKSDSNETLMFKVLDIGVNVWYN